MQRHAVLARRSCSDSGENDPVIREDQRLDARDSHELRGSGMLADEESSAAQAIFPHRPRGRGYAPSFVISDVVAMPPTRKLDLPEAPPPPASWAQALPSPRTLTRHEVDRLPGNNEVEFTFHGAERSVLRDISRRAFKEAPRESRDSVYIWKRKNTQIGESRKNIAYR